MDRLNKQISALLGFRYEHQGLRRVVGRWSSKGFMEGVRLEPSPRPGRGAHLVEEVGHRDWRGCRGCGRQEGVAWAKAPRHGKIRNLCDLLESRCDVTLQERRGRERPGPISQHRLRPRKDCGCHSLDPCRPHVAPEHLTCGQSKLRGKCKTYSRLQRIGTKKNVW